jgi:hypothetical protein
MPIESLKVRIAAKAVSLEEPGCLPLARIRSDCGVESVQTLRQRPAYCDRLALLTVLSCVGARKARPTKPLI